MLKHVYMIRSSQRNRLFFFMQIYMNLKGKKIRRRDKGETVERERERKGESQNRGEMGRELKICYL